MNKSFKLSLSVFSSLTISLLSVMIFSLITLAQGEWNQLDPPNAPSARSGHSMVTLPDGRIVMFGGEGSNVDLFNDLYIFKENDWTEEETTSSKPSGRKNAASWTAEEKLYIHGGEGTGGEILEDMWIYDFYIHQWDEVELDDTSPGPLTKHSAVPFEDGKVLISGGRLSETTSSLNTYIYDPTANSFEEKARAPFGTREQSMIVNEDEALNIQVFGENEEMMSYNRTSDQWSSSLPEPPDNHPGLMASAAYCDADKNGAYVIGGQEYDFDTGWQMVKNVWKYDAVKKLWDKITELPAYKLHATAAYDAAKDRLLLFGGKDENGDPVNDMHEYSFSTTGVKNNDKLVNQFSLQQNYPNPFNPSTTINFTISTSQHSSSYQGEKLLTSLKIYNILGLETKTLLNEQLHPGEYEVKFDADNLPSGVYFYKLTAGKYSQTKKMILIK